MKMKKNNKLNIILILVFLFLLSLFPKQEILWFLSTVIYIVLLTFVYCLETFKTTTKCLLAEMLATAAIAFLMLQIDMYLMNAIYMIGIFAFLSLALLFEAKRQKEKYYKILLYAVMGIMLFITLRASLKNTVLRIRQDKFETRIKAEAATSQMK